jgi:hypothetical protein
MDTDLVSEAIYSGGGLQFGKAFSVEPSIEDLARRNQHTRL